jgi:hypothetical protein
MIDIALAVIVLGVMVIAVAVDLSRADERALPP